MQALRKTIKRSLALLLCSATLMTIQPTFAETEADNHAQHNVDWSGVYNGFLPCNDCQGIKSTLALNANNTYILISQFVGKSNREITEKGSFVWNTQDNTLVLTPRKDLPPRYYLMGENDLTVLDDKGNHITGNNAERYILHKMKMKANSQTSSHSAH
jgi:uncharacterized lipoprotein NlpE involved in copper resistance